MNAVQDKQPALFQTQRETLINVIDNLSETVTALEQRLDFFMKCYSPEETSNKDQTSRSSSISAFMDETAGKVIHLDSRLLDVLKRLDI